MSEPTVKGTAVTTTAMRRARLASIVGSSVEWYDYFLFGAASALIFGSQYFPGTSPLMGTLSAFAVFGVGFVARPVGGLFFGRMGDRLGRKGTLIMTLVLMGAATTGVGLLPTADQIGIAAPVLLVLLRLLQGFAAGGEWGGAALVAIENAPPYRRARWGSFPQMGVALGAVLSSLTFGAVSALPEELFHSWGWRIPFLFSVVLIVVGLWIRKRVEETPEFDRRRAEGDVADQPIKETLTGYRRSLLVTTGMRISENVYGYMALTFALSYVTAGGEISASTALYGLAFATLAGCIFYYISATVSDRVGRKPVFIAGCVFGIIYAFPFFWLLDSGSAPLVWIALLLGWGAAGGINYAIEPAYFTELFGDRVRYSGISIGYQMGSVITGFAPFVATALLASTNGEPWSASLFLVAVSCLSLVSVLLASDPYREKLRGRPVPDAGMLGDASPRASR